MAHRTLTAGLATVGRAVGPRRERLRGEVPVARLARRLGVLLTTIGAAGALVLPHVTYAQQTGAELHVMPVRGNVFMIVGGGSNVTVSAGVDGVLMVDTGSAAMADKVLAKVKEIGEYGDRISASHDDLRWSFLLPGGKLGTLPAVWLGGTLVQRDHRIAEAPETDSMDHPDDARS